MLTTALAVLFLGSLALIVFLSVDRTRAGEIRRAPPWTWALSGVLLLAALVSLALVEIPAGHVGVVSSFGKVQEDELPPGLHFVLPIVNDVEDIETRVRQVRLEGYTAASREQQDLFLTLTLNYHLRSAEASTMVQEVGTDYEAKIILPRLQDIPKTVTDDYPTNTVLNEREEIRQLMAQLLRDELEPYGIVVDNILLENFSYSPEYNASIEQKQIEEQRVSTERQILEQQRIQAEQAVVQAEGVANARIAEARGEAEANRLITESLTPALLQWTAIQRLQDNVQIMLVPSDGGLILDVGGFTGQAAPEEPAP